MTETEITVQVMCSLNELIALAQKQGYTVSGTYTITDRYYTNLAKVKGVPFKNLVASSFLVRSISENGQEEGQLVYKSKHFDTSGTVVLSEEKVKTQLGSASKAAQVLQKAGFLPYATIINHSTVLKRGEIEFSAQNIEGLGLFIEMEEFAFQKGKPETQIMAELVQLLQQIGLPLGTNYACQKLWMMVNN